MYGIEIGSPRPIRHADCSHWCPLAHRQSKFIEINEAYAVLSDPDQRRKYDLMSSNPFSGSSSWGRSSTSSYSSSRSSSRGSGVPPGTGDFDFDAYWKRYRGSDESPRDIDDSFTKIFDDLFTGEDDEEYDWFW